MTEAFSPTETKIVCAMVNHLKGVVNCDWDAAAAEAGYATGNSMMRQWYKLKTRRGIGGEGRGVGNGGGGKGGRGSGSVSAQGEGVGGGAGAGIGAGNGADPVGGGGDKKRKGPAKGGASKKMKAEVVGEDAEDVKVKDEDGLDTAVEADVKGERV